MEPLNLSLTLIERVVTMRKVYELHWKEEGIPQIRDNNGVFGDIGLIFVEGARWVRDNSLWYAVRVWIQGNIREKRLVCLTR